MMMDMDMDMEEGSYYDEEDYGTEINMSGQGIGTSSELNQQIYN